MKTKIILILSVMVMLMCLVSCEGNIMNTNTDNVTFNTAGQGASTDLETTVPSTQEVIPSHTTDNTIIVKSQTTSGKVKITYPVISNVEYEEVANNAIKEDSQYTITHAGAFDTDLDTDINYEVIKNNSVILSIKYTGVGTTPNRNEEARYPIQYLYGTNIDKNTGKLLYLSDVFNISDDFVNVFRTHGISQVVDSTGRPFEFVMPTNLKRRLSETDIDSHESFYFEGNNLVIVVIMYDDQQYPVTIPASEVKQDLKSEYKNVFE